MTICPCCGFKFEGELRLGCIGCGARSVGEPLARPEHQLPAYGRAMVVSVVGVSTLLLFLIVTIVTLVGPASSPLEDSSFLLVLQKAAWHLKWVGFPLALASVWLGARLYLSILKQPARFMGLSAARTGLAASIVFALLMTSLVGISLPRRLRARKLGIEASYRALLYTHNRAFLEYRARFGTYPTEINDLRNLPDADGSIAQLLAQSGLANYKPWAELAAAQPASTKSSRLRGAAIRQASLNSGSDDSPREGVPFTNYELRLPGDDKILGTADDWLMRDGIVRPVSAVNPSLTFSSSIISAH